MTHPDDAASPPHDFTDFQNPSPESYAPKTDAEAESDWVPIPGRVIKGVVAYYNRKTHRIRITKRWHGAKVTEDVKLPPPLSPPDSATH
jgi:hypothetical protein